MSRIRRPPIQDRRGGRDGEVVGVDTGETMLEAARERTEHTGSVRFELGDATGPSFAGDSFDAVQSERVLVHTEGADQALSELARVTRTEADEWLEECRQPVCLPHWGTPLEKDAE